jgi:hypothetical protein
MQGHPVDDERHEDRVHRRSSASASLSLGRPYRERLYLEGIKAVSRGVSNAQRGKKYLSHLGCKVSPLETKIQKWVNKEKKREGRGKKED